MAKRPQYSIEPFPGTIIKDAKDKKIYLDPEYYGNEPRKVLDISRIDEGIVHIQTKEELDLKYQKELEVYFCRSIANMIMTFADPLAQHFEYGSRWDGATLIDITNYSYPETNFFIGKKKHYLRDEEMFDDICRLYPEQAKSMKGKSGRWQDDWQLELSVSLDDDSSSITFSMWSSRLYTIKKNETLITSHLDPSYDLQSGDAGTKVYQIGKTSVLIVNKGDVPSVILMRYLR